MDGGVVFLDNLHFLDSQIGKVDQDGQIEIWKKYTKYNIHLFLPKHFFHKYSQIRIVNVHNWRNYDRQKESSKKLKNVKLGLNIKSDNYSNN